MKRFKISLAVLAVIFAAGSAFTAKKVITYTDAVGNPITQAQYLACPNLNTVTCGIKYDNGLEVERRFDQD